MSITFICQKATTPEDIKASVTIPEVAARLYPKWKPAKSCRSPFRPDRNASFSVFNDSRRWWDFAEGTGGDVVDFVRRALGCSFEEAIKYLCGCVSAYKQVPSRSPRRVLESSRQTRHCPSLRKPSQTELQYIAEMRGLSVKGLKLAVSHGLLWTASYYGFPSWAVTDSERRVVSFRRLNGQTWRDGRKALFVQGSQSAYPVGLPESRNFPAILLVEGAPDLLAAFQCIHEAGLEDRVTAVSILSASVRIPDLCLPSFMGKSVRIFAHGDTPGQEAGERWAKQLKAVTARVEVFLFDGFSIANDEAVTDLNELVRLGVSVDNILGGLGR